MSLHYLPLAQLALIVDDLLTNPKRIAALSAYDPTGRAAKRLEVKKIELDLLPEELKSIPLAERTSAQDQDHDARARCLYRLAEALKRWPDRTPAMNAAGTFILTDVVPSLEVTQASFGDQVAHTSHIKEKVEAQKAALSAIKTPDDKDLYQWVTSFVASGEALGALLQDRADTLAEAKDRRAASVLRPRIIADLNKLRDDVREALELDEKLPRDLEAQIFSYADELNRLDKERRPSPRAEEKAPEPTPA